MKNNLKRNSIFTLFVFLSFSFVAYSQNVTVSGHVVDAVKGAPIEQATVRLYKATKDSTFITGLNSDNKGSFQFKNIPAGKYFVRIDLLGFGKAFQNFSVIKAPIDLGRISLSESEVMLKEAVVTGQVAEMVIKKDTLEYNPAAYKLLPGTAVEGMLKRMSGVEVDQDGKITVAGKEVKRIFIDGKQYFGKDPTIASKNIPIEIVDKLQVIDKKSDLALLTGIDDGNEETVINLTIKKGMKKGWLANAKVGLGKETENLKDGELRYETSAVINRFLGDSQFSVIANDNNVNIRPSRDWGSSNGQQMGMRSARNSGSGTGVTVSDVIGTNFAVAPSEKLKMGGNVLYNRFVNNARSTSVQTPLMDSVPFNQKAYSSYSKSENLTFDMRVEYNPDSAFSFVLTPSLGYNRSNSSSESNIFTFRGLAKDSVNSSFSTPTSENNGFTANLKLDMAYQFKKKGRRLSFSVESGINQTDGTGFNFSKTHYYALNKDSVLNQEIDNNSKAVNYSFYTAYMEPVGVNNFLQMSYLIRSNRTQTDRYSYKMDQNQNYTVLDTAYSKSLDNEFINQQIGLSFRSVREKYGYTIGVDLEPSTTNSKRFVGDKILNNVKGRSVLNVAPNLNYTYRIAKDQDLRIDYRGRTSQPSITQLDPTPDVSNPLNIRKGNPDLLPSYSNNLTMRFSNMNRKEQRGIMGFIRGNYNFNDIISKSTFDASGIQNTSYVNESGNWSLAGTFMYNSPIPISKFQVNSFTNTSYDNRIGYTAVNKVSQRNIANTFRFSESLGLTWRNDAIYTQLRGNYSYTKTLNSLTTTKSQVNTSYGTTFTAQINLPYRFILSSDVRYTANRGLSTGYNKDETLWNAELSKLLFSKQQGTVSIKLNDILHQQLSISRNVTNNYIEDVEYNTLTSYFMVAFAYRFNTMGGGAKRSSNSNWGDRPEGGRRRFDGGER